ncbi:MAG TPA: hypothetical protein VH723_03715 [Candidatus Limnocylindrales bacterium]|jgi:hypothetical protein
MPVRLPPPGPSFVRERELRLDDRRLTVGLGRPSVGPDGWWLAVAWAADEDGVATFADVAPAAGPPPDPPVARLGASIAATLSGWILEEGGRLAIRLAPVVPPDDPSRPWRNPIAVRAAFKFEPARAGTVTPNALAELVLDAFAGALEGLRRR